MVKKTKRKKSKFKSRILSLILFSVQTQSISVSLKSFDINKEELCVLYEKIVRRNIKNIVNMKNILEK